MNSQITLTLPPDVMARAELLARRTGRLVSDLLAETIELSLRPLGAAPAEGKPPAEWSEEEVLAAADAEMPAADDQRLSALLDRQQAGTLTEAERAALAALMQVYQEQLLRKAQGLREAVRRGLRESPQP